MKGVSKVVSRDNFMGIESHVNINDVYNDDSAEESNNNLLLVLI